VLIIKKEKKKQTNKKPPTNRSQKLSGQKEPQKLIYSSLMLRPDDTHCSPVILPLLNPCYFQSPFSPSRAQKQLPGGPTP